MNLMDATVKEVVIPAYESWGKWWVVVKYDCWGCEGQGSVMCSTEEEAKSVGPGYVFQI